MAVFPRRDLEGEIRKHFHGTPDERLRLALRLGRRALDFFMASLPPAVSRAEAAEILRRNKHRGRRPSKVMEASRS